MTKNNKNMGTPIRNKKTMMGDNITLKRHID
jgi:hypothetical protein